MDILFVLLIIAVVAVVMIGVFWIANRRRVQRRQEVEDYQSAHKLLDKSIEIVGQSLQIDANLLKARLDYAIKYGDRRDTAIIEEEYGTFLAKRADFSESMVAAVNYDLKRFERFERLPLNHTNELRASHEVWRTIERDLITKEDELKGLHVKYFTVGQ